jgi:hypothetical protein
LKGFWLSHGHGDQKLFNHHEGVAIEFFSIKHLAYGDRKVFGCHSHMATEFDHHSMAPIKFRRH